MIKFIFNDTDIKISVAIHKPNTNIVSLIEPVNIKIVQAHDNYLKKYNNCFRKPRINWYKMAKECKIIYFTQQKWINLL